MNGLDAMNIILKMKEREEVINKLLINNNDNKENRVLKDILDETRNTVKELEDKLKMVNLDDYEEEVYVKPCVELITEETGPINVVSEPDKNEDDTDFLKEVDDIDNVEVEGIEEVDEKTPIKDEPKEEVEGTGDKNDLEEKDFNVDFDNDDNFDMGGDFSFDDTEINTNDTGNDKVKIGSLDDFDFDGGFEFE